MDFSHLRRHDVTQGRTSRLTLYEVEGEPTLIGKPATEANRPYFNAALRRFKGRARAMQAGAVSPAFIAQNREEDRELYALHVLEGWEDVVDAQGQAVPFSREAAKAFLDALPDWLFDVVRQHFGNPATFMEEGVAMAEETAGN